MRRWIGIFLCVALLCLPVKAKPEKKYVALTFDDGPSGKYTRQLLEGLAQRGVKATFLLCGYRIAEDAATARQIFDAGHEIGLHGYSHKSMGDIPNRCPSITHSTPKWQNNTMVSSLGFSTR